MPSGKDRKEDTWKESDLKKALKPDDKKKSKDDSKRPKEHSSHKSDDRKDRKDRDDDRKRRGHDDVANGEADHRRTDRNRDREIDRDRERRRRDEDRDKERTRDRDRDHDRERRREKDATERSKDSERSKESKERTREKEISRERRKEKDSGDKERDRERRRDRDTEKGKHGESGSERRERHGEQDRSKQRHGERDRRIEKSSEDRDREGERTKERRGERDRRKERSSEDRERERRKEKESERRGEADGHEGHRDRDTSRERRKEKEREERDKGKERTKEREKDRDKERDKDRERRKERDRERLDKENRDSDKADRRRSDRHEKDSERRSRNEESSKERRHDERKDDRRERKEDKDRRKERSEKSDERDKEDRIKRREKELMESLKQEEELRKERLKFRSDTLEEADIVEEDVEKRREASLKRLPSVGAAEEVHDEENDGYDYDDEDFEDYDEDFEDDEEGDDDETSVDVQDSSGMQELLQALNAENEDARASSSEGREEPKEHKEPHKDKVRPTTATHGRINFVAAKQKQISDKVASRTRRRGQELMHLIDLDVAVFDIFDLPPLNEYELYIKNFGRSDTKQAYVQCNEDNLEKDIQTEEIEMRTKWTQHPASDAAGFGDDEDDSKDDLSSLTEKANIDSLRLSKFIQRAAQTCLILLEENISEQANTQFKERKDMTCSDGFMQLSTKQLYLEGRPVKCVHISPLQTHFLLVAYGPVKEKSKVPSKIHSCIQEKGLVCFWNTNEPSEPQKVLICESTPRCCCLSPSKAHLAFAGLNDGSLVAWDLREPSSIHFTSRISVGDSEVILRPPTFSTAGVLRKDESHLSPVVSLLPLVMPGDRLLLQDISAATSARASGGLNVMSDDMLGLSFQLASLEENAAIYLWVVVELDKANSAGSESDLGLSPGGKIKLIKSSSISLQSPFRDLGNKMSLQALTVRFLPHDPNHVYVGTDAGYVLHCERHGGRAPPKVHRPDIENVVRITALDLSPWQLPCMLAGSESGNLWLFNLKNESPLISWPASTGGSEILSVQWSRSRPSVFYVLDSNSNLHVWDLLKSDQGPVAVEKFKHGRVTCFELSSDYSASGIGITGRHPELVLVYESGAVEIHKISSVFAKASGDELDRFASYLDSVL